METHFAPPERADSTTFQKDIEKVANNSVLDALLKFESGILGVLNEERQILALNDTFLRFLGIPDPLEALGLRPGEAVGCIHAHETEGGCGTSEFCSSCGAAISIVSALATHEPVERKCALTIEEENQQAELLLKVRSVPIIIDNRIYLVLFLNDITGEQQAAVMEKVFFHDINNIVFSILGSAELLTSDQNYDNDLIRQIYTSSLHLAREIAMQRALLQGNIDGYQPHYERVLVADVIESVKNLFAAHPVTSGKKLIVPEIHHDISLETDRTLLIRILMNMVKNALEATQAGGQVIVSLKEVSRSLSFVVWNSGVIPENIQKRIFQRNFTTKEELGRGLGTYSMKYFGEQVLGGYVDFSSSEQDGTRFQLTLNLGASSACSKTKIDT